jgi:hypothetical protein
MISAKYDIQFITEVNYGNKIFITEGGLAPTV